jgi:hypothetical protein
MVYESGSKKGTFGFYSAGSIGQVLVDNTGVVQYVVDGETRYTSQKDPVYPLNVDVSFHDEGAEFENIKWVGSSAIARDLLLVSPLPSPTSMVLGPGDLVCCERLLVAETVGIVVPCLSMLSQLQTHRTAFLV